MAEIKLLRDIRDADGNVLGPKNEVVTVSDKHAKLMVSLGYAKYPEKKIVKKQMPKKNNGGL